MPEETVRVDQETELVVPDTVHDRYATFGLLGWWDHKRVRNATVLVAGAGALGNEVLKNLALIGIGRVVIIDLDMIEAANLSRSVLFREADQGANKAERAAAAVQELNPDVKTCWINGDLTRELGLGVFRHADAVVGCLDNREARLFVNRACYQVDRPWIDGAIHEMLGEVRVFWPGRGACYECTLVKADYQAMNMRYSCSSLARDLIQEGKIATTPTIASIIAGVQTQEVLKLLHGMEVNPGAALVFNGYINECYSVSYPCKADCLSHEILDPIEECPDLSAGSTTLRDMLAFVRRQLGRDAVLDLRFDLLVDLECAKGHGGELVLKPLESIKESAAKCPSCGCQRWPRLTHTIDGSEPFLDLTLSEIGVPELAILSGRSATEERHFELAHDSSHAWIQHKFGEPGE